MAVTIGLFFAPGAMAGPEKTPDQTPNDHPSGKDRSDKPADGDTQGASTSDPDGMANGGADKPGGDGGFDDDKDGNNGCGNDDDFEDDNNGWCGGKPKANAQAGMSLKASKATRSNSVNRMAKLEIRNEQVKSSVLSNVQTGELGASVLGVSFVRTAAPEVQASAVTATAANTTAAAPAGTLARTGQNVATLAALSMLLVLIGSVLVLASEQRRQPIAVRTRATR